MTRFRVGEVVLVKMVVDHSLWPDNKYMKVHEAAQEFAPSVWVLPSSGRPLRRAKRRKSVKY